MLRINEPIPRIKFSVKKIAGIFLFLALCTFLYVEGKGQFRFKGEAKSPGSLVNSPFDEQNPVLSPDGELLFFTRSKHPENQGGRKDNGDIWFSEREETGSWKPAKNAGTQLNNRYFNSVIGFSGDGRWIYLVGHYEVNGSLPVGQGISISEKKGDSWTNPQPVEIKYFKKYTDHHHACLSADGQIMIHSVESYDSKGTEDLYVSFRRHDGSWTDIQNLGRQVNTRYQEMSPWLSPDNKILVFSSNGLGGEGSFDLYLSKRLDETWKNWSVPENLGPLVNSNGRELGYYVDNERLIAYFCSTLNSDGYGDLKMIGVSFPDTIMQKEESLLFVDTSGTEFIEEKKITLLKGRILSSKDNSPVGGIISLFLSNNAPIGQVETKPEDGSYSIEILSKQDFRIQVTARGYMSIEGYLRPDSSENNLITRDFYLEPLEEGRVFKLDNVLFMRSTSVLLDSSYAQLDLVYEMLRENPDISIELSGHTDNQGDAKKNLQLSEDRVQVVRDYLVSKGVKETRIEGKGYGGMHPVASNATEATRQLNRRVEFKVLRKQDTRE